MEFIEETKLVETNGFLEPQEAAAAPLLRNRSSTRMRYEAEIEIIKKNIGDLEEIRARLGLTARSMSQLLLTDPSAWTRWTRGVTPPPPHVYRMLEWYLVIKDKVPWLANEYYEKSGQGRTQNQFTGLHEQIRLLTSKIQDLQTQTEILKRDTLRWQRISGLILGLSLLAMAILRLL